MLQPSNMKAIQSPLLRLPLELRRIIYWQSIVVSRSPTPQVVHESNLCAHWEDLPSPLLRVNRQVRDEVFDILQKRPFTMRVTSYGATFDMLGLSCFIAQKQPKTCENLPFLWIEIWPPHPDRPIDMYRIWDHIRKLRDKLRHPRIQKLMIWFVESKLAKWSQDGEPRYVLDRINLRDDMRLILDHFICIKPVTKARMRLPPSLNRNDEVKQYASCVIEGTLVKSGLFTVGMDPLLSKTTERDLKKATALIARAKLDAITCNGEHKMSYADYLEFTKVWPHFEHLRHHDEGGRYKGKQHYVEEPADIGRSFEDGSDNRYISLRSASRPQSPTSIPRFNKNESQNISRP
ncbi:hypothetical protein MMC12_007491 [Toensbergia leucococca]|nr:hypothetical protein [Toensbergia leucococca]